MNKKGDTLIEVTIAIGIFSMVAIAIVSVMISGTSNAQTALETTLTREEIDTQAEALRFIHSSYIAEQSLPEGSATPYSTLWGNIISNAYTPQDNPLNNTSDDIYLKYNPSSCQEIYPEDDNNLGSYAISKGFIIDPKVLSSDSPNGAYKKYVRNFFKPASTYPRLVYESISTLNGGVNTQVKSEGLYVLAVKDPSSTQIIDSGNRKDPAYYDFYIRSCWYGTGSDTPSTISTVIRLYDPAVTQTVQP